MCDFSHLMCIHVYQLYQTCYESLCDLWCILVIWDVRYHISGMRYDITHDMICMYMKPYYQYIIYTVYLNHTISYDIPCYVYISCIFRISSHISNYIYHIPTLIYNIAPLFLHHTFLYHITNHTYYMRLIFRHILSCYIYHSRSYFI